MTRIYVPPNKFFKTTDIFGLAALNVFLNNYTIHRTNYPDLFEGDTYLIGVGGYYNPDKNRFDYKQENFNKYHSNGIKYSSFGLIWKKFGSDICDRFIKNDEFQTVAEREDFTHKIADYVNSKFVIAIDADANNIKAYEEKYHIGIITVSEIISILNYNEEDFYNTLDIASSILKNVIFYIIEKNKTLENTTLEEKKMGIRCIIKTNDILKFGPLDISYSDIPEVDIPYAKLPGWETPGDYFITTIEFDFNSWGGTKTWLEKWLHENKVPYMIS
jgi:uncharacterized UPF0160 family protein